MEPERVKTGVAEKNLCFGTGSGVLGENGTDIFIDVIKSHDDLSYASKRSGMLKYRSPVSGSIATIILPSLSGRAATASAAYVAAPLEIPARIPSSFASLR